MRKRPLLLAEAIASLRKLYGRPARPVTTDPFELVLWENVAYLAPPARHREAFEHLKRTVGTSPARILGATKAALDRVTAHGILKDAFTAKLRECARIASERSGSDLDSVVRQPLPAARRALRAFPGIGEPGAEKILLARLGFIREEKSYARMYAASREAARGLPGKPGALQEAHLLLQQHGRTLCKRTAPRCVACPLESRCAHASR